MAIAKGRKIAVKNIPAKNERIHYDIMSKRRGDICTVQNEGAARDTLMALHDENEDHWRKQSSEGKRYPKSDAFCLCRQGIKSWELPFFFAEDSDEEYGEDTENA